MSDVYIRDPENDLTYDSSTGSYVLTSSLISDYTLTIVPTPSDATVTLTAEGYAQSGNSITVTEGLIVIYNVVRSGYIQKSGSVVVDSDITLNITLYPVEVDPIDESTTVKELEVNSIVYDIVGKGILDQNSKTTKTEWVGTKAEYDALGVYADYCTYIITDDSADSQSDEVGAIAEDINTVKGDINTLNGEVNTLKGYDYVVDWQAPTSANGYKWYRKYKSGWVEQGGQTSVSANATLAVALSKTMANANYFCAASGIHSSVDDRDYMGVAARSTTTITIANGHNAAVTFVWQVSGVAA